MHAACNGAGFLLIAASNLPLLRRTEGKVMLTANLLSAVLLALSSYVALTKNRHLPPPRSPQPAPPRVKPDATLLLAFAVSTVLWLSWLLQRRKSRSSAGTLSFPRGPSPVSALVGDSVRVCARASKQITEPAGPTEGYTDASSVFVVCVSAGLWVRQRCWATCWCRPV